jgi:hypothetical protein
LKWFEYGTAKRTTKKFKWINPRTGKGLKKRNANQFGRRTIGEHGNTLLGKTGWTHNRGQIKPTPFYLLAMSAMGDDAAELWKIAFYRAIENLTKKNRKIKKTVTQ